MPDRIELVTPLGRQWDPVIRLVLGGIADRLDLGFEELDDLRLAFFGVGATPVRARNAEAALTAGDVDAAVAALARDLDPPDDVQAEGKVKRHLAGVLLRRVARQLREPPR